MSEKVIRFLESKNIAISTTAGETRHNQVSESINHRVKTLVALPLISKETKALKKWRKIMPSKFKGMSLKQRAQNRDFRKLLFESELFNNKRYESIINAIHTYNKKDFSKGITLGQAEYFNTKLVSKNSDNVQILRSQSMLAKKVQKENKTSIESVKTVIENILGLDLTPDEKLMKIALLTLTPATVYYDEDNRLIVSFNQTSGDLITGDRQRENVFNRFMADNTLGGLQWISKWRNN